MAEVVHVFICDRAYEDDRGQPCVIGMFDHIWAPQFPLNPDFRFGCGTLRPGQVGAP